ncbi:MAG: threonine/serine exporter family protein, partial [Clostridia bacterium]
MSYLYQYIVCIVVIFFVGLSLRTKPWISLLGGLAGGIGYLVYLLCPVPKIGFLLSALVITLFSELLARLCKMPANNFLVLGI